MSLKTRDMINEILKINKDDSYIIMPEIIEVIYIIYKDIEKIKQHLKIDN